MDMDKVQFIETYNCQSFLSLLKDSHKDLAYVVLEEITKSNNIEVYSYHADNKDWAVYDGETFKYTVNDDESYRCFFSKETGLNIRCGKTIGEDPKYCGLGNEILDLEISQNGCVPVPESTNCRYCYKNNTNAPATNMSFETFKAIVDRFPKNLSQIAFGITGLQTNPDLERMFQYCREIGIVPNVTTVGADMDEHMLNVLAKECGAIAVSCYAGAKELCYKTISDIYNKGNELGRIIHVNMHIVVSKDNLPHVWDVLKDVSENKVYGLNAIVFLRIKPKGRASKMDCKIPLEIYDELVTYCLENKIRFGFDSCSATPVMKVLKQKGMENLCENCEKCESGLLSGYINVKGEYWNCSFAEGTSFIKPINVLDYESVIDWWNGPELQRVRNYPNPACNSCPIYDLD